MSKEDFDTEKKIISNILNHYWTNYSRLREENQSLSNLVFHEKYGLSIKFPWEWISPIKDLIQDVTNLNSAAHIVIVYYDTEMYQSLYKSFLANVLDEKISVLSWQEIYWSIHVAQKDARPMHDISNKIGQASLILVCGSSKMDTIVLDHVRNQSYGCLVFVN